MNADATAAARRVTARLDEGLNPRHEDLVEVLEGFGDEIARLSGSLAHSEAEVDRLRAERARIDHARADRVAKRAASGECDDPGCGDFHPAIAEAEADRLRGERDRLADALVAVREALRQMLGAIGLASLTAQHG